MGSPFYTFLSFQGGGQCGLRNRRRLHRLSPSGSPSPSPGVVVVQGDFDPALLHIETEDAHTQGPALGEHHASAHLHQHGVSSAASRRTAALFASVLGRRPLR